MKKNQPSSSTAVSGTGSVTVKSRKITGKNIQSYDTEKEMLEAWRDFVINVDPTVITGWNIVGFDFKYLLKRMELLNEKSRFFNLSRNRRFVCKIKEKEYTSRAQGTLDCFELAMPGRLILCLLEWWRRSGLKARSFKRTT